MNKTCKDKILSAISTECLRRVLPISRTKSFGTATNLLEYAGESTRWLLGQCGVVGVVF